MNITVSEYYKDDSSVRQFAEHIESIFESGGTVLHGERNVIKHFKPGEPGSPDREVIVKRFKRPAFVQRIVYTYVRRSKAERSFRNACELRNRGISAPREIAFIENRKGGLLDYCYFISEPDFSPPIINQLREYDDCKDNFETDFAYFVAQLHENGILHHDLNSTNTLFGRTEEGDYTFSLIDNNRMHFYPAGKIPPVKACLKNLCRFTKRSDIFKHVIYCYCAHRLWEDDRAERGIKMKWKFDMQRRRRKAFLKTFKSKR
ncbi:MAG: lipopolysaccharide kinase InaA family protein [Tannerella sp.]|jgi:tRNA A-37 threonylcarbamoyl transferase component Bud32|nr:lipopolysaccharide kinase InaA family protein [Tannerella sp.]